MFWKGDGHVGTSQLIVLMARRTSTSEICSFLPSETHHVEESFIVLPPLFGALHTINSTYLYERAPSFSNPWVAATPGTLHHIRLNNN
jgi:hypothetical protein